MKKFSLRLALAFFLALSFSIWPQGLPSSPSGPALSLEEEDDFTLPDYLLAFPFGSRDHERKIIKSGPDPVIWTQRKVNSWARGQGFAISQDSPDGGYRFGRAMLFYPPGVTFTLRASITEKADYSAHGWFLVLDMGFLQSEKSLKILSSDFRYYENILRYEILIDHISYKTVEIGYGVTELSPIRIAIPYIRDRAGNVLIEIRMKNHPNLFGVIYDAYLTMGG